MCRPATDGRDLHSWGPRAVAFDLARAAEQWDALRETIVSLGVTVDVLEGSTALASQFACGDAALVSGSQALVARFAQSHRDGERTIAAASLAQRGLELIEPPGSVVFEASQAVVSNLTLFGGWFQTSELLGLRWAARKLTMRLVPVRLEADDFDRLDLCFRPLRDEIALIVPEALSTASLTQIRDHVSLLLPVPIDEAHRGACAAVVFGHHVVVPASCPVTQAMLDAAGFAVHPVDVSEFLSLGCSLSGLVLSL